MSDVTIELKEDELHIQEIGIAFDAHMHIQSSHTAPLPLLWHTMFPATPLPILNRGLIDRFSRIIVGVKAGGRIFSSKPGYLMFQENVIGRIVAEKNLITFLEMPTKKDDNGKPACLFKRIFSPMIVMPMDMEYAHISGFDDFGDEKVGHTIYHENDTSAWYYRHRKKVFEIKPTGRMGPVKESDGKKIKLWGLRSRESEKKKDDITFTEQKFKRKYIGRNTYTNLYNQYLHNPDMYHNMTEKQQEYIDTMADGERQLLSNEKISVELSEMFVKWSNQFDRTMQAAFENPLHLIPMFHYDPRRWNDGEYNDKSLSHGPNGFPLKEKFIATNNSSEAIPGKTIFAGIKMYPPLGYKPYDLRFGTKNNEGIYNGKRIDAFYSLCHKNKVPILAHCSPGGVVTHDSRKYMELDKKQEELLKFDNAGKITYNDYKELDKERDRLEKYIDTNPQETEAYESLVYIRKAQKNLRNKERDCYFANEYVHPKNWERVIGDFENINVCMAHFGGSEWIKTFFGNPDNIGLKSPWIQKTIELLKTYKNAYTDISCFTLKYDENDKIVNDKDVEKNTFKKEFKAFLLQALNGIFDGTCKVLDKILFGTDWYLTLNTYKHCDYQPYMEEYKAFLDSINKGLWIKFSMINPFYYYGFDKKDKIESLCTGLKNKTSKKGKELLKERKEFLLGLTKDGKNKMEALEQMVTNVYKIKSGRPY